ncbi:hypothetical protein [Pseudomonas sp. IT-P44]|uniref:hypothetical protein n=1 Tax=Pseudomonas sp. IT-P44 TaxID=3026451 RepID=UPI0039E080F8
MSAYIQLYILKNTIQNKGLQRCRPLSFLVVVTHGLRWHFMQTYDIRLPPVFGLPQVIGCLHGQPLAAGAYTGEFQAQR